MGGFPEAFSRAVTVFAVAGLLSLSVGVLICALNRSLKEWLGRKHCLIMSVCAITSIIVGGTKHPLPLIHWDDGLYNNGSSIDTNDLRRLTVSWTYESWIPSVATFSLSYVTRLNPEPSPVLIGTCPITNLSMSVYMETDATNYMFYAEQSFIPDAPVVTNGVYHVKCLDGGRGAITNIVAEWHYYTNGVEFPAVVQPYWDDVEELLVTPDFRLPDGYSISFWEGVVFDASPAISEWSQDATFYNEESDDQYDVVVDARLESRTNIISGTVWVPIGLKIYGDGEAISPPSK